MTDQPEFTVLAIDPGYDRVGWAIGLASNRNWSVQAYGCIQTKKKDLVLDRYRQISSELSEVIRKYKPREIALETLLFSKNVTTAIRVSEARGIIISTCLQPKVKLFEYNPMTIKSSVTGNGKADKKSMSKMVTLQLGISAENQKDDTMDALGVLITHMILEHGSQHRKVSKFK